MGSIFRKRQPSWWALTGHLKAESCPNTMGGTKTVSIVVLLVREMNRLINLHKIPAAMKGKGESEKEGLRVRPGDFPGGPVVKTPCSQ